MKFVKKEKEESANPFSLINDPEKHEFFRQMTSAINDWMLKQYPEFDNELVEKIKQIREIQNQVQISLREREREWDSIKEKHLNFITGQINEFLKKQYPDLSRESVLNMKEIKKIVDQHSENVQKIKSKLETVMKSDNLYKDVYELRDEFKEIKKFMDNFKKKVKTAFDI